MLADVLFCPTNDCFKQWKKALALIGEKVLIALWLGLIELLLDQTDACQHFQSSGEYAGSNALSRAFKCAIGALTHR